MSDWDAETVREAQERIRASAEALGHASATSEVGSLRDDALALVGLADWLVDRLATVESERDEFRRNSVLNLGAMSRWRKRAEGAERTVSALRLAVAEASTHVHDCKELLTPATRRAMSESVAALTDVLP